MEKAAALVHQYVPPDPQKIQAAQKAGNVAVQPDAGATTLTVKSYIKAGDSLSLGFDPGAVVNVADATPEIFVISVRMSCCMRATRSDSARCPSGIEMRSVWM